MRAAYFDNHVTAEYPSDVRFNAIPHSDSLLVRLRGAAKLVETEGGSHFENGHWEETCVTKEQALDLAHEIIKHYDADSFLERLAADSFLGEQIERLAAAIMTMFDDEPSENAGAVDTAIRLLGDYAALLHAKQKLDEGKAQAARALIAAGIRKGQTEQSRLDTPGHADTTVPGSVLDVAFRDGSNEPSLVSSPLGGQHVFVDVDTLRNSQDNRSLPSTIHTINHHSIDEEIGRGDHGYDVVSPQPQG